LGGVVERGENAKRERSNKGGEERGEKRVSTTPKFVANTENLLASQLCPELLTTQ